jgi:alpha-L-rhamnosidase
MATNSSVSPAGLIARLDLTSASNATHLVSDAGWKSTDTAPANWQAIAFDDSGWQSAQVVAALGSAPWGALE